MLHKLVKGIKEICNIKGLSVRFSKEAIDFLKLLDHYGQNRYLDKMYVAHSHQIFMLDKLVAEIRKYCSIDAREIEHDGDIRNLRIPGGVLERIIDDKSNPAREPLIWKNMYFGSRKRNKIALSTQKYTIAEFPILIRSPSLFNELSKYVKLPNEISKAYKKQLTKP